MQINPYLQFQGNCEAAFEFYAAALRGQVHVMKYAQAPPGEGVSEAMRDEVMHAHLQAGAAVLMGVGFTAALHRDRGGIFGLFGAQGYGGSGADFMALAQGGEIRMPVQETFWAARFGMFRINSTFLGW